MIEPAGVIVMEVSQDHGGDVARRIDAHRLQPVPDLFERRDLDHNLLGEKGVPPREITRHRIAPGVTRVHKETPFRMLNEKRQNR